MLSARDQNCVLILVQIDDLLPSSAAAPEIRSRACPTYMSRSLEITFQILRSISACQAVQAAGTHLLAFFAAQKE